VSAALNLASVKRNAEQSPLLRLPAEIRDMIWKLALGGNVIRPVRSKSHVRGFFHPFPQVDTNGPHPPAYRFSLLQVCRQIYSEAASLPCHLSTFCFYDDLDLELWQRQAPASKTKLVRSVRYGSWESTLESVLETQRHIQGMEKLQNVQHYDVQFFSYQTHFQSQHDLATFERLKLEVEADNKVQFTYECHSSLQVWQSIFSQGSKSRQASQISVVYVLTHCASSLSLQSSFREGT
jgi:hypothetical protein